MFLLLYNPNRRKKSPKNKTYTTPSKKQEDTSLAALRKIIRNRSSSTKELQDALSLVLKYHGDIHPKLGIRAHPDFDAYAEILFTIARHKNINKDIIVKFDKELEKRNPAYKKEIYEELMKGLNSRGV
jgi:hypothetical protein